MDKNPEAIKSRFEARDLFTAARIPPKRDHEIIPLSINMTRKYARMADKLVSEEMQKLEGK